MYWSIWCAPSRPSWDYDRTRGAGLRARLSFASAYPTSLQRSSFLLRAFKLLGRRIVTFRPSAVASEGHKVWGDPEASLLGARTHPSRAGSNDRTMPPRGACLPSSRKRWRDGMSISQNESAGLKTARSHMATAGLKWNAMSMRHVVGAVPPLNRTRGHRHRSAGCVQTIPYVKLAQVCHLALRPSMESLT